MSIWAPLNRSVFKKTSTYFFVATLFTFFFERAFDNICVEIFERANPNKLFKDVTGRFKPKPVIVCAPK